MPYTGEGTQFACIAGQFFPVTDYHISFDTHRQSSINFKNGSSIAYNYNTGDDVSVSGSLKVRARKQTVSLPTPHRIYLFTDTKNYLIEVAAHVVSPLQGFEQRMYEVEFRGSSVSVAAHSVPKDL